MARPHSPRPPVPLDGKKLEEMALRYVGKYETSRAKLIAYLSRKVRERGWNGSVEPDLDALAKRFSDLGYIDDAAYALAKSRALSRRGYGRRRLDEKLRLAGIAQDDAAAALEQAREQALEAALRFAQRRRIGPYAAARFDDKQRERAIASMVRAGHPLAISRAIASLEPGTQIDAEQLSEQSRLDP